MDSRSERLFDKRTVRRNLDKGVITKEEYQRYLDGLPDVSDKAVPLKDSPQGTKEGEGGDARPEGEGSSGG